MEVGLRSRGCASSFCANKDGLELWLSLEKQCFGEQANPYFVEQTSQSQSTSPALWSPTSAGALSALLGVSAFVVGIALGTKSI
jgi:hypothetical protein